MLVVLASADAGENFLGPDPLRRLSELGVTNVSLLRDETTVGVVLEGWTFDPARSASKAAEIVAADGRRRTLLPVMQAAVVPSHRKGVQA